MRAFGSGRGGVVGGHSFGPACRGPGMPPAQPQALARNTILSANLKHLVLYFFLFFTLLWFVNKFIRSHFAFLWLNLENQLILLVLELQVHRKKGKSCFEFWLLQKSFLKICFCCWSRRKVLIILIIMYACVWKEKEGWSKTKREGRGNHLKHVRLGCGGPAGCPWA